MTLMANTLSFHEQETAEIAAKLIPELRAGDVIFLRGNLGAGKTTFARALIRALTNNPNLEVPSPTFTLVQTYESPLAPLWHFDLYRLKDADEIFELGWEDAVQDIAIVEWPENLKNHAPRRYLDITLSRVDNEQHQRRITISRIES